MQCEDQLPLAMRVPRHLRLVIRKVELSGNRRPIRQIGVEGRDSRE